VTEPFGQWTEPPLFKRECGMFRKQEWDSDSDLKVIQVSRTGEARFIPSIQPVQPAAEAPSPAEPKATAVAATRKGLGAAL
jgi:hypothetical protein